MHFHTTPFVALALLIGAVAGASLNQGMLFSGCANGDINSWNANTGGLIRTRKVHQDIVTTVEVVPNGTLLFSGSYDNTIMMWDVATGTHLRTMTGHRNHIQDIIVSRNGKLLFSASDDNDVRMWSVDTGNTLRNLTGHNSTVYSVDLTPDGTRLVSASGDQTVIVWDINNGSQIHVITGHNAPVLFVVVVSNDIAYTGALNIISKVNITQGTLLNVIATLTTTVIDLILFRDGVTLISADAALTVIEWNTTDDTQIRNFTSVASPYALSNSPRVDSIFIGMSENGIVEANTTTGSTVRTFPGPSSPVWSLAYSASASWTPDPTTTVPPPPTTTTTNTTPTTTAGPAGVELLAAILRISSSNVNLTMFGPSGTNASLVDEVGGTLMSDLSTALLVSRRWIVLSSATRVAVNSALLNGSADNISAIEYAFKVTVPSDEAHSYNVVQLFAKQLELLILVPRVNAASLTSFSNLVAATTGVADPGIAASASTTATPDLFETVLGLSGGAVAGIVIGSIAAVVIAVVAVVCVCCRNRAKVSS